MSDERKTETVVVVDANAAHKLIGRSIGGHEVNRAIIGTVGWNLEGGLGRILWVGDWGESVEVDALPPATIRMAWYDAITDGAKIVHPTGKVERKLNRAIRNLADATAARDRLAATLAKHRRWAAHRADANLSHPDTGDTE